MQKNVAAFMAFDYAGAMTAVIANVTCGYIVDESTRCPHLSNDLLNKRRNSYGRKLYYPKFTAATTS